MNIPLRSQAIRARVLQAVKDGNITKGSRGEHKWWLNEEEYRRLTDAEKRHLRDLRVEGVVEFYMTPGYRYTLRGYYALKGQG